MTPSVEAILALTGASSVLGVIALAAYLYLFQKIKALEGSEFRSVREIVEGEGIFKAEQVIQILQTFAGDDARLAALKELAKVQNRSTEGASRVYGKIKDEINVNELEKQRFVHIRRLTLGAAPFFFLIGFASLTYGAYSNPEIATAITNFIHGKGTGSDPAPIPVPTPTPKHLGHVTITPKIKTTSRETSTHPATMISGKGKNSTYRVQFNVLPDLAKQGWKIDIESLVAARDWWQQDKGEGGSSCTGLDRSSANDNGFVFLIQLGRNKDAFHEWDAVQYCNLTKVPLVRAAEQDVDGEPIERDLLWNSDALVPLPQNTISYVMLLAIDGYPERILTADSPSPYGFLGITKKDNTVLFQPEESSAAARRN